MNIRNRGLFPTIGDQLAHFAAWLLTQFAGVKAVLFGQPEQTGGDGNDRIYKNVTVASVIISMLLSILSFLGSYTAVTAFAINNGIDPAVAAWIAVSIDGFIILGIVVIFGASLVGARVGWVKVVVFACTMISVNFNIAHITTTYTEWEHYLLGAVFPLVVYGSAEITSRQIRHYITRCGSLKTNDQLSTQITTLKTQQASLSTDIETERVQLLAAAQRSVSEAVAELEEHRNTLTSQNEAAGRRLKKLKAGAASLTTQTDITTEDLQIAIWIGQALTNDEIGERLGKSVTTGSNKRRRVMQRIKEQPNVSSNGHG